MDFLNRLFFTIKKSKMGTSLVVRWLRLCAPNAGGPGLIPAQEIISHLPQLRVPVLQLKIPCAATKTQHSHIKKIV